MCPAICGNGGPMSLPYSFDFPGQLKNWILVQGVPPSFIVLANKFSFVVPSSSHRIVWVFWIFFFLLRRVSPLLFRQPAKVCILESHLRRRRCIEWAWFNTHHAIGFPRSDRHPWTFRCNRTRCGGGTCRNKRRHIHHCWWRLGHNSFFFLISNTLRHCGAAYQAEILDEASGAGKADIDQIEDCSTHHVWNFLWSTCPRVGVWCQYKGFEFLGQS